MLFSLFIQLEGKVAAHALLTKCSQKLKTWNIKRSTLSYLSSNPFTLKHAFVVVVFYQGPTAEASLVEITLAPSTGKKEKCKTD